MPIYEYRCEECGQVIELIQKFSDAPLTKCESCGGKLEKLLSPPGLQFKGSGWYVTDYARAGQKKDGKSSEITESLKSDTKSKSDKSDSSVKKPAAPAAKSS